MTQTDPEISAFIMTYNLAGCNVPSGSLSFIPQGFDIYVLGFEEVGPFVPLVASKSQNHLSSVLKTQFPSNFEIITDTSLLAIKLYIIVKSTLKSRITNVKTIKVQTGADGAYGNKGGIGCSFTIDETPMLFIVAHFAAGDKQIAERNKNFATIMEQIQQQLMMNPLTSFYYIFFVGDLNYRIQSTYAEVKRLATAGRYMDMMEFDQLTSEKRAMKVFSGFYEADIGFPPTYRFDKKGITYDTSEKARVPSYTDRILIFTRSRKSIEIEEYGANMDILISDHRPVFLKGKLSLVPLYSCVEKSQPSICCSVQ